jgi:hypothetical protein
MYSGNGKFRTLVRNPEKHLGCLGVDERIILKRTIKKYDLKARNYCT